MATVRNPTAFPLLCLPLLEVIDPDEEVECSSEVAAQVSRAVFIVTDDEPRATPVRKAAARGSKVVETTEAPEVETR